MRSRRDCSTINADTDRFRSSHSGSENDLGPTVAAQTAAARAPPPSLAPWVMSPTGESVTRPASKYQRTEHPAIDGLKHGLYANALGGAAAHSCCSIAADSFLLYPRHCGQDRPAGLVVTLGFRQQPASIRRTAANRTRASSTAARTARCRHSPVLVEAEPAASAPGTTWWNKPGLSSVRVSCCGGTRSGLSRAVFRRGGGAISHRIIPAS